MVMRGSSCQSWTVQSPPVHNGVGNSLAPVTLSGVYFCPSAREKADNANAPAFDERINGSPDTSRPVPWSS